MLQADSAPAPRVAATRLRIFVGLLLSLGVGVLPLPTWGEELRSLGPFANNDILFWAAVAVLLAYVLFVERRPLASIGLRRLTPAGILVGLAAGIVLFVLLAIEYVVVLPALHLTIDQTSLQKILAPPLLFRLFSVARAAVSEEVLFRGYPIERLDELTGNRWFGAVVSCTIFSLAHVQYWGWGHLIVAATGGIALTLLYVWRRNLWINIIAHAFVDGVAMVVPPT